MKLQQLIPVEDIWTGECSSRLREEAERSEDMERAGFATAMMFPPLDEIT